MIIKETLYLFVRRLRTSASEVSPASDFYKLQPRRTTMINNPYHHDLSSQEDNLHLFGKALPTYSPAPDPVKKNTNSLWPTANNLFQCPNVKNIPSYNDSTLHSNVLLSPFAAVLSPEDQRIVENENMRGEPSGTQEQLKQSKSVSCVVQKIPQNISSEQKHQQHENEQGERGNDAVISGQKRPDPPQPVIERTLKTSTEVHKDPEPRQKTGEDLRSKLSAFEFKARKLRVPVNNVDLNVHQENTSRTPASVSVFGSVSRQMDQQPSSSGRKRKHTCKDSDSESTSE